MKSVRSLAPSLLLLLIGSVAQADLPEPENFKETAEFIAREQRETQASEAALATIRSAADLSAYLQSRKASPFDALGERSRKLLVESLVFTDQGLGSYRYREIETELTPRQAYELLGLFGAQRTVGYLRFSRGSAAERAAVAKLAPIFREDHRGYRCTPPATCVVASDHICIGANCGTFPP